MDINSTEARMVQADFSAGRMVMAASGFFNIETGCYYGKTNHDRFVRADARTQQLNLLSADKTHFHPIGALRSGEGFGSADQPQMQMQELLPPPSLWQRTQSVLPGLGAMLGAAVVGAAVHTAYDYVSHHDHHGHAHDDHSHDAAHAADWHSEPAHHDVCDAHAQPTAPTVSDTSHAQPRISRYVRNAEMKPDTIHWHTDADNVTTYEHNGDFTPDNHWFEKRVLRMDY